MTLRARETPLFRGAIITINEEQSENSVRMLRFFQPSHYMYTVTSARHKTNV